MIVFKAPGQRTETSVGKDGNSVCNNIEISFGLTNA